MRSDLSAIPEVRDARRGMSALALEVPASVHADFCKLVEDAFEALSRAAPSGTDMVLVPQSALDWLFGSGPDATGKWFGEVEDAFPTMKSLGDRRPPFWWRVHFRSLIAAREGGE